MEFNKEQVTADLLRGIATLGPDTYTAITRLRDAGLKGKPENCEACLIARYLHKREGSGLADVEVSVEPMNAEGKSGPVKANEWINWYVTATENVPSKLLKNREDVRDPLPGHLAKIAYDFDHHVFPDMEDMPERFLGDDGEDYEL